jgi:hypothetical protein
MLSEGKRLQNIRRALKGMMTPTALSISEAARATRRPQTELARMAKRRLVASWLRDGEVRIPLAEVERLTLRRPSPAMPETMRRRR